MSHELVRALQERWHAQLVETHISWVLLDGTHAWKIKKPVKLPFLDFSSLAERKRLIEAELLLNRRLAPSLYLDVCPITGTPQAPEPGGEGVAIEYALRMRQFPADALFSTRLAQGRLTVAHVTQLAQHMAAFHATAPQAGPGSDWGSPSRHVQAIESLLQGLHAHGRAQACARLRPRLASQAQALEPHWLARQEAGRVVEGHGDLHLANVVVLEEGVTAFDCIEFDPALRWVDGLSDIAFMVMDLMAHQRLDLATCCLNAYLDERGDHDGLPVLRFYLVYRALVRALVACLRADQRADPNYLALALHLSQPEPTGLLITHGVSGSGKTHVSRLLAQEMGAVHLRADVIRKRLFGLAPLADSQEAIAQGIYHPQAHADTYARLLDLAEKALRAGWPVIVDATFLDGAERRRFAALAATLKRPFGIVDCHAPHEVLAQRIGQRRAQGGDASEATLAVLATQLTRHQGLSPAEQACSLQVHADRAWSVAGLIAQWQSMQ